MTARPKDRTMVATASILVALAATIPVFAHDPAQHQRETPSAATDAEAPFLAENDAAMTKMMNDMTVKPTGDVDRDFVEMMVPHHQGAIDMALAELRYGKNEQLKRIAQEIIVDAAAGDRCDAPRPRRSAAAVRAGANTGFSAVVRLFRCRHVSHARHESLDEIGELKGTVMKRPIGTLSLVAFTMLAPAASVAGQAPGASSDPDIAVSHRDRVYAAEQFSNTVSVTDPASNKLLGVIRLGDPQPGNFSPLYKGQVLVHGMGFSPDHKTIAVVSIGSNSVTFIDTATNASSTRPMSAVRRTRPSSRQTARKSG